MKDPTHPIWAIVRFAVIGLVLIGLLSCTYQSGWAPQDYITTITVLGTLAGIDILKALSSRNSGAGQNE